MNFPASGPVVGDRINQEGTLQMFSEGKHNSARIFGFLAIILFICQPAHAQRVLRLPIPVSEFGQDPISFMRAPYTVRAAMMTSPYGFTPAQIRHAYGFDLVQNQGAGQVIGIVDAYDDPNIEADLGVFSRQFNLPACTSANGCFRKVYATGRKPVGNSNWGVEIALDVEWAHAIAPQATILLVEANSNSLNDLFSAVDVAVRNGASAVSMSWTSGEFSSETRQDTHFAVTGVTFLAASGDIGTGVAYPASSPDVIGVGGTALQLDSNGNYKSETAWSGSGGGISMYEREPLFQASMPIPYDTRGYRGAPDVSYVASPSTGVAIYDSYGISGASGWFQVGGTSAGAPQWAALIGIANSMRASSRKARLSGTDTAIYSVAKKGLATNFLGVTQGTNGMCGTMCTALAGYDYVTGLGSPKANVLIPALAAQ
jgi:subtilase family serine protease